MKRFYIKLCLVLLGIILLADSNAQGRRRGGFGNRTTTTWCAGAEIKVRSLNNDQITNLKSTSTVEVTLIYYRACSDAPGTTYISPTANDSALMLMYSPTCCTYLLLSGKFDVNASDAFATPYCPYSVSDDKCTKCESAIASIDGYRTEIYVDTVELPCRASDWTISHQFSSVKTVGSHGQNTYPKKYVSDGVGCPTTQMEPLPPNGQGLARVLANFACRFQATNTLSQQTDGSESMMYIEAIYSNAVDVAGVMFNDGKGNLFPKKVANNTPLSVASPFIYQCHDKLHEYDLGYYDLDDHIIKIYPDKPLKEKCFGDPSCGTFPNPVPLTFLGGYSPENPLGGSSLYNVDPNTGVVTLRADNGVGQYKTAFRIEEYDRNTGAFIGKTLRDVVITIIGYGAKTYDPQCEDLSSVANASTFIPAMTNTVKGCRQIPGTNVIETCAGNDVEFSVEAKSESPDYGLEVDVTFHPDLEKIGFEKISRLRLYQFDDDSITKIIKGKIPANFPSGSYPIIFNIRACIGCFVISKTLVLNFRVNKKNTLTRELGGYSSRFPTWAYYDDIKSNSVNECGAGLPINAFATNLEPGVSSMMIINPNSPGKLNPPNVDTVFGAVNSLNFTPKAPYGAYNDTVILITDQYCNNSDTLYVKSMPPMSPSWIFDTLKLDLDTPKILCFNDEVLMTVTNLPPVAGAYLFDWQNLGSEFLEQPVPSIYSNQATAKLNHQSNFYNVYVLSPNSCVYTLTKDFEINGIRPKLDYATDKQYVCPGDTIRTGTELLTVAICGQSQFSKPVGPDRVATFLGEESNLDPTPKMFTYNNTIDRGITEILYKGSELRKMGFKPGLIKELQFSIDGIDDPTSYKNIDMWIKCTDKYDLDKNEFTDTLKMTKIYANSSKNLSSGWNSFTLMSGFTWDGETNILLKVKTFCNMNCSKPVGVPPIYNDHITPYVSMIGVYSKDSRYLEDDSLNVNPNNPKVFNKYTVEGNVRHNIRFIYQDLDQTNLSYKWTDIRGDSNVLKYSLYHHTTRSTQTGFHDSIPFFVLDYPTDYVVEVKNGKCYAKDTVKAYIDTNYKINITPDVATKCPGDTVKVSTQKGYIPLIPLVLTCGIHNKRFDSARVGDSMFYPLISNPLKKDSINRASPFGGTNNFFGSAATDKRIQMLYTADELKANPKMRMGYIDSIFFDVNFKFSNTNDLNNFSIKMKCVSPWIEQITTNKTTAANYANSYNFTPPTDFEEVYFKATQKTIFGRNYFALDTQFAWDGKSGIMVEICYDNQSTQPYNADQVYATNTGTKTPKCIWSATQAAGNFYGCTFRTGSIDSIRPNIGFVMIKPTRRPPSIPEAVVWAPPQYISNTKIDTPTIYNFNTGKYWVILDYVDTNFGGRKVTCRVRDTTLIKVDRPEIQFAPSNVFACENKPVIVSAGVLGMNQNLYNYEWDTTRSRGFDYSQYTNPNLSINPPNAQYIYVTVSSVNNPNCYNTDSVFVGLQRQKTMPDLGSSALICPGDSVMLSIPSNIGYKNPRWVYKGDIVDTNYSFKVGKVGDYHMIVDSGACTNTSLTKNVSYRTQNIATLVDTVFKICEGDSALLTYTVGDNVANPLWNNGQTTPSIKVNQEGIYYLIRPKDQYGCYMINPNTAEVTIVPNPPFVLNNDTLCMSAGQKVILQPVPMDATAKYYWEPTNINSPFLEVYSPNVYKVTRRKGNCEMTAMATVITDTIGSLSLGKNQAVCCDEQVTLDANTNGKNYKNFRWSTGEKSQIIHTKLNASGYYIVEAFKPNGCKDTGSIFVKSICGKVKGQPQQTQIQLGQTNKIFAEHLDLGKDAMVSYKWIASDDINILLNGDSLNPTVKAKDTGDVEYYLVMTVKDSNYMPPKAPCVENEVVRFKVMPNSLDTVNVFTPNGDGINDYIYPQIAGIVKVLEYKIYNRQGQKMHDDADKGWDGKVGGIVQPIGVYVAYLTYEVELPRKPKEIKRMKIPITLLR